VCDKSPALSGAFSLKRHAKPEGAAEPPGSSLPRTCEIAVPFRIIRRQMHENADPPHLVRLLRARRERPSCCRAAEQRDELAPL